MEIHIGGRRVIKPKTVVAKGVGSRSTIWRYLRTDPSFPRPIILGSNSIGFFEDEIDRWLESRPRRTYAAEAA